MKQLIALCTTFIILLAEASAQAVAPAPVAKTGQTSSYVAGDDGALQPGVAWPTLRFTDNNNKTITDTLTGLIWSKVANTPGPAVCGPGTFKSWQGALDYVKCLNLNVWLGETDWRLPNRKELSSLVNLQQTSTNSWLLTQGFTFIGNEYWSSSTNAGNTGDAWIVTMGFGVVNNYNKTNNGYVWPVRSGQYWVFDPLIISTSPAFGAFNDATASVTHPVEIGNRGLSAITISAIAISGINSGDFTVDSGGSTPCGSLSPTLAAGASCTMQITAAFTTSPGTKRANLTITANGVDNNVPLSSTVIASPPVISSFTIPVTSTSLTVSITSFVASDNVAVTNYCLNETNSSSGCSWSATKPTTYTFAIGGNKNLYAFAKDAIGNLSTSVSATIAVDIMTPTISFFSIPATSTSLTIPITALNATDDVGITGYCLSETNISSGCSWSATKPTNYTFVSSGIKTLYVFVKDASNKVSSGISASSDVATLPTVTNFNLPASTTLTIPITTFTATDNVAVTGYCLSETNSSVYCVWSTTVPSSYTFANSGSNTLYAFAKDAIGNISTSVSSVSDVATKPIISAFTIPATRASPVIPITTFTATDNVAVTGYCLSETNSSVYCVWSTTVPSSYTFANSGSNTLYAFAKDAIGNISTSVSSVSVIDTTKPTVTAFTIPATSTTLTIPISTFTATDNVGVTGYCLSETSSIAADCIWNATAPTSHTFATSGSKVLYAFAKDAAGNISSYVWAGLFIDTTKPTVTAFVIPATSTTLTIPITTFTATDDVAVTDYCLTENIPGDGGCNWSATAPTSYKFADNGSKTLYAFARDADGYNSAPATATVQINATKPIMTAFTMPTIYNNQSIPVLSVNATDVLGVNGYMITTTPYTPSATSNGWFANTPYAIPITLIGKSGIYTFYAWAKNNDNNVSAALSASVNLDLDTPMVTAFSMAWPNNGLTMQVSTITAIDDYGGVTGYMITESTSPLVSDSGWSATIPASYTFSSGGGKYLYAWAKDAAGNVSSPYGIQVYINLPDTIAPIVTQFTLPTTATSLLVPVTALIATDEVGVTGRLVSETSSQPQSNDPNWSGSSPTVFEFLSQGTKTLYAFAKDAAGNISAPLSAQVTITLPDTTAPVVTTFTIPTNATGLSVPISALVATDGVGIAAYLLNESGSQPQANDPAWSEVKPASFLFLSQGAKILYAFAKDVAGNISVPLSAPVTITLSDSTAPVVLSFSIPATAANLIVPVSSFVATDAAGVTGYFLSETSSVPLLADSRWTTMPSNFYAFADAGSKTLYAFARDAAGNISTPLSGTVTITLTDTSAPTVTVFAMPTTATNLIVPVTTFSANDNTAVTGYILTESSTAPLASASGWTSTAPSAYTFGTAGSKTLYAFAKDAAGNISAPLSAGIAVTLSDTTAPTVTAFAIPATSSSLTVPIITFTASDNSAVTGYMLSEVSSSPLLTAQDWSSTATGSYTFGTGGNKTLYAFAKDAAGNVSPPASDSTTITLIPQFTVTPTTGSGYNISPATPQTVNNNGTTTFTINPASGYGIAAVSGCNGNFIGSTYTTAATTADCAVTVTAIARTARNGTAQPTITDALKVLLAVVGITPLNASEQIRYDVAPLAVNGTPLGNGIIDSSDVILILRRSIGIGSW